MDEFTLTLNSPITEEQWDTIADVDFDHTNEITFHTKHGKQAKFVKRMRGRWIESEADGFVCSVCRNGYKNQPTCMGKPMFEFCPICGADMTEG